MRDLFRRRLRIAGPLVAVVAVVGLAAWLGPKLRDRKNAVPPDGDTSLLVLVRVTDAEGRVKHHRLVRVGFRGGEPQPPEPVWEGGAEFFTFLGRHRVVDGRYLVASSGGVIDVWANEELSPSASGVIEVTGERVVVRRDGRTETGLFAFDLRTRKVERVGDAIGGPDGDPRKRSPDGIKALSVVGSTIRLYGGGPQRVLGTDFFVQQSKLSSDSGVPPVLWLDNQRILTQAGNGNLVAVALDGARVPVAKIPAKTEIVSSPRLERDPDDRVVYTCGDEGFVINVDAKTWERCEWASLGHEFDVSWKPTGDRYAVRHQQKEVGEVEGSPLRAGQATAVEGRLAILGVGRRVRVWFAGRGAWTELDTPADALVGWLK